jgi:hypothetical protein
MNKFKQVLGVIQLPIILIVLLFIIYKQYSIEEKIVNTNTLLFTQNKKAEVSILNQVNTTDIVLGNAQSSNIMVVYMRYDCSACEGFYENTISSLIKNEIKNDELKIIFRFLAHETKLERLKWAMSAYQASECGLFNEFLSTKFSTKPDPEKAMEDWFIDKNCNSINQDKYSEYILQTASEARGVYVRSTPTSFINGKRVVGAISYDKLIKLLVPSF